MAGLHALNVNNVGSTPTPGSMTMTAEMLTDIFTMYADTNHNMQRLWEIVNEHETLDRDVITTLMYAAFIWGMESAITDEDMIANLREVSKEFHSQNS